MPAYPTKSLPEDHRWGFEALCRYLGLCDAEARPAGKKQKNAAAKEAILSNCRECHAFLERQHSLEPELMRGMRPVTLLPNLSPGNRAYELEEVQKGELPDLFGSGLRGSEQRKENNKRQH